MELIGQVADFCIKMGAVPSHVEQEHYLTLAIAVKAQYIPTTFQALLSEDPR